MSRRRAEGESVHDYQHTLIDEREAVYRAAPRRSGLDRIRRREHYKRAVGTLRGHLNGEHGLRNLSPLAGLDDLAALHDRQHQP